jgi:hypothetical protein
MKREERRAKGEERRPLPWARLMEAIGEARFEDVRKDLAARAIADLDRDAFLLNGVAAALLREMVPEDAPAEAVTAYGALLHSIYVCWARDWPLATVDADSLREALLAARASPLAARPSLACYVRFPPRLVWGQPTPGAVHEPLDGAFLQVHAGRARVLAVLGFHELREGFTTMEGEARLPLETPTSRADGTAPFAPVLPGGDLAKLVSVVDTHELVALALLALDTAERG